MEKIHPISLKLNFTLDTFGCNGLRYANFADSSNHLVSQSKKHLFSSGGKKALRHLPLNHTLGNRITRYLRCVI